MKQSMIETRKRDRDQTKMREKDERTDRESYNTEMRTGREEVLTV